MLITQKYHFNCVLNLCIHLWCYTIVALLNWLFLYLNKLSLPSKLLYCNNSQRWGFRTILCLKAVFHKVQAWTMINKIFISRWFHCQKPILLCNILQFTNFSTNNIYCFTMGSSCPTGTKTILRQWKEWDDGKIFDESLN